MDMHPDPPSSDKVKDSSSADQDLSMHGRSWTAEDGVFSFWHH